MTETDKTGSGLSGIERAMDVLTLFVELDEPSLGVTQIARELNLAKAVVHRIVAAFCAKGFLRVDEATRRYVLGPEILFLGVRALQRLEVRDVAKPHMLGLVADTRETATLSIRVGLSRVYIEQVLPDRDVKMVVQLGQRYPLYAGASSKAMLAFLPDAEQDAYFDTQRLVSITDTTITNVPDLRRELHTVRSQRYAVSLGERDTFAGSAAAPIFNHDGEVVAVMSVSGPIDRVRPRIDELAHLLLAVTNTVSSELGQRNAGSLSPMLGQRNVGSLSATTDLERV